MTNQRPDDDTPTTRGDLRRLGLDVAPEHGPPLPPTAQAVGLNTWAQVSARAAAATAPGYPVASPIAPGTKATIRCKVIPPPGPESRVISVTPLRCEKFDGNDVAVSDLSGVRISPLTGTQIAKAAQPRPVPFPGSSGSATAGVLVPTVS